MEKEQRIHYGYRGNGLCVWTECGNKKKADFSAHIQPTREITYYQDNTPAYFKKFVENMAKNGNVIFSNGEKEPAFLVLEPINKPTKYCDTKFYGRYLFSEEIVDGKKVTCNGRSVLNWNNLKDYDPESKRKVYFVCDLKYGKNCIFHFAWSFSRERAEQMLPFYRQNNVDINSDFKVMEFDEQYLVKIGECAGNFLDY